MELQVFADFLALALAVSIQETVKKPNFNLKARKIGLAQLIQSQEREKIRLV